MARRFTAQDQAVLVIVCFVNLGRNVDLYSLDLARKERLPRLSNCQKNPCQVTNINIVINFCLKNVCFSCFFLFQISRWTLLTIWRRRRIGRAWNSKIRFHSPVKLAISILLFLKNFTEFDKQIKKTTRVTRYIFFFLQSS
jgi:hypothetical protein